MRDFSGDHRWLSLNTITLPKSGSFGDRVDACARAGIRAIAPWRDEVAAFGVSEAAKAVRDAGLDLSSYCRAAMLVADADHLAAARDDNRRAIDEAAVLGGCPLVVVTGGLPQFSRPGSQPSKDIATARRMVEDELAALLIHARAAGVPLALEPLHPMLAADRGCINTMRQALDICDRLDPSGSGAIGLAVDAYHVWWDHELAGQIARAGRDRLLVFQVSDWLVPTAHTLNDRGMMGDGIIDLRLIRGWVEAAGFAGYAEVEIFSDRWWREPRDDVIRTCVDRFRRFV